MKSLAPGIVRWWVGPGSGGPPGHLISRWLFLRALGVIYFSAFYSLLFQIRGMLGPDGLLPVGAYLQEIAKVMGSARYWYAPTLLWFGSGDRALLVLCWVGITGSVLLVVNLWPRAMLLVCFVCFLSFVTAAQDFSGYQSDGMLLCAGFICLFFAPGGGRPGWGKREPPPRAPLFLLQFLWFTIYFESGIAKYFGGDPSWRDLSAMNEYYQNGPLPTWIGWYAEQLPVWCHETTAFIILCAELLVVWLVLLPRGARILCFWFMTCLQIGIILTANYAFLNYIVLALGIFLLDDSFLVRIVRKRWRSAIPENLQQPSRVPWHKSLLEFFESSPESLSIATATERGEAQRQVDTKQVPESKWRSLPAELLVSLGLWTKAILLVWIFYAMAYLMFQQASPGQLLPAKPVAILEPFRIANSYGLFGRMTWARYEIEFQGSNDGTNWTPYPFRYKPQDPGEAPGIYAPYQPRFEWNLWFASLGTWRENPFVPRTEQQLLLANPDVLALFRWNPFAAAPPKQVRSVLWQYWFTDRATKKSRGDWWRREERGLYAPTLERTDDGKIIVSKWPQNFMPPP